MSKSEDVVAAASTGATISAGAVTSSPSVGDVPLCQNWVIEPPLEGVVEDPVHVLMSSSALNTALKISTSDVTAMAIVPPTRKPSQKLRPATDRSTPIPKPDPTILRRRWVSQSEPASPNPYAVPATN